MNDDTPRQRDQEESTSTSPGSADLVGAGTGGSPTGAGAQEPIDRAEAAREPEVAALVDDLRHEGGDPRIDTDEAARQAGTGTDR